MKSLEELKHYFTNDLSADVELVEKKRRKIISKVIALAALIGVLLIIITIVIFNIVSDLTMALGWAALFMLVLPTIGYIFYMDITSDKAFYREFKSRVIQKVITFMYPDLHYNPKGYIPANKFNESKLFALHPTRYKGDDHVQGSVKSGTRIAFSEVTAQRKMKKGEQGGKKTKEADIVTIFQGLFFVAETDKDFQGTIILPKHEKFDPVALGFKQNEFRLCSSNNAEFDNYFQVYSRDTSIYDDSATVELFNKLVDFRKSHNDDIHVSFLGHDIYVAISHSHELFEPRLYHSLFDFATIQEYYDVLFPALLIVDTIVLESHGLGKTKSSTNIPSDQPQPVARRKETLTPAAQVALTSKLEEISGVVPSEVPTDNNQLADTLADLSNTSSAEINATPSAQATQGVVTPKENSKPSFNPKDKKKKKKKK